MAEIAYPSAADDAAARCRFELTYARTELPRPLEPGWLGGPRIPDSRGPQYGDLCGSWDDGATSLPPPGRLDDVGAWIDHYAGMAIAQAVHEVCEWFHVDGQPWVDPHELPWEAVDGPVRELVARLAELRKGDST